MVALNFQTTSTMPMQLNAGLFRANGGSGYVLKPPETRPGGDAPVPWDEEKGAVTVLRMRLIYGELLPLPGEQRHEASAADDALDPHAHPPEAGRVHQYEPLMPYVTVEVYGGSFGGAARTMQSAVHGSRYRSDYARGGFAPVWNETLEAVSSHPAQALLRVCVWHRRVQLDKAYDELIGVEVLPLWALRPGYRVLRLCDVHGSRIRLAKLVVHIEARRDTLAKREVRQTYHSGEHERKHKQVVGERLGDPLGMEVGIFGFVKRKLYVSDCSGILKLKVKRPTPSTPRPSPPRLPHPACCAAPALLARAAGEAARWQRRSGARVLLHRGRHGGGEL